MLESHVVTISRFAVDQERHVPEATGAFTSLLHDIALAAKVIGREVNKAGLVDILGAAGRENVYGEDVQKLDAFANQVMYRALDHTGLVACMASEENDDFIPIPDKFPAGDYVVIFDPLDNDDLEGIADIQLRGLGKLLAHRRISLDVTEPAKKRIVDLGYEPAFGARPLKRVILKELQDPMAMAMLEGGYDAGDTIEVGVTDDEFTFNKS